MSCDPARRYWLPYNTGSLNNNTLSVQQVDFSTIRQRHPEVRWWRLDQIQLTRDQTATAGNLMLTGMSSAGVSLGDLVLGAGQTAFDLMMLFPMDWNGLMDLTFQNRTGATATFIMAFGVQPLPESGRW